MTRPVQWPPPRYPGRHETQQAVVTGVLTLEDGPVVQCGFCMGMGPASRMYPATDGVHRCADPFDCADRWIRGEGRPLPLLPQGVPAEAEAAPEDAPGPVLHPDQEAALEAFNAAHDAEEARTTDPEPEPPAEAAPEPRTEGEEPAPAADDAPTALIAEVPAGPSHPPAQGDPAED